MKVEIFVFSVSLRLIAVMIAGVLIWEREVAAQVAYDTIQLPGVVVTGIRADSPSTVLITASYVTSGTSTQSALYQGTLEGVLKAPASQWTLLTPVFSGQTVTSSSFYGPNTSFLNPTLGSMNLRAVGSYKYTTGPSGPNYDHGMMYEGKIGSGHWTQLDATSLVPPGDTLLNTICHSTMGDLIVGNYDSKLVAGKAFIFNVKTGRWVDFNPTGSKSVTAYGIWQNGGSLSHSYTIAGGFSDLDTGGLDQGYLVDYDLVTGNLTHLKKFNYKNQTSSIISHFDGITGTGDGYHLTGDYAAVEAPSSTSDATSAKPTVGNAGFFTSIKRLQDGSFGDAVWTEIAFTNPSGAVASVTSGNTVIGHHVLGIYVDGTTSSYVATVGEIRPSK